ncbi:hypothetical protein [Roseateles cellulosilyticus]|uniref:hypothetical protein n=1 Tax=Pelomonas cellulosilytica TaxID=2906762 RepID=UPI0032C246F8
MNLDTDRIDDAVLVLLLMDCTMASPLGSPSLGRHGLAARLGLIGDPMRPSESMVLTDEGLREAQRLLQALFERRG